MARAADAGEGGAAVTLRPGPAAEVAAPARIHCLARAAARPGLREPWGEAAVVARPGDTTLPTHRRVRVAVVAGSPVACLGLDRAEVLHLHAAAGFQRRGIGGRLPAEAIAAAPVGLAVPSFERNQAARQLYERHGFRIADRQAASAHEDGEPDLRYVRAPKAAPNQTEEREP
ncbi:GNAT family N-acetyltransferase [Dankookia sp. GCM10030260]